MTPAITVPRRSFPRWSRIPRVLRILLIIAAVLLAVRMALPTVVAWQINRALQGNASYPGRISGITIALWRGAYVIHDLELRVKRGDGVPKPLLAVERLDIALAWEPLLHGSIRSSIELDHPTFIIAPSGPARTDASLPPAKDGGGKPTPPSADREERWQDRVDSVIPFRIDTLRIRHGEARYVDDIRNVDLRITGIEAVAHHIAGGRGGDGAPASFAIDGTTTGNGHLHLEGAAKPWEPMPDFDVRGSLEFVHLVDFNPSAKRFNGLRFRSGVFSAFCELHATGGALEGYVKPLISGLEVDVYGTEEQSAATTLFWKAAAVVAENILPNDDTDALAARVPLKGRFDEPNTDTWTIIGSTLGNAFLSAILPGFEGIEHYTKG